MLPGVQRHGKWQEHAAEDWQFIALSSAVAVIDITHRMGNTHKNLLLLPVPCFHLSPPTSLYCYLCYRDAPYLYSEICMYGIIALFYPVKARLCHLCLHVNPTLLLGCVQQLPERCLFIQAL